MSTLASIPTITIRVPDNGLDGIVERSVKISELVKLVRTAHQRSWRGVVETRDARLQLGWVLNQAKWRLGVREFAAVKDRLHIDPRSVERAMAVARAFADEQTGRMDMNKVGDALVRRGLAQWVDAAGMVQNGPGVTVSKAARGPLSDERKSLRRKLVAKVGARLGGESLRRFEDYFDGIDRVSYRMLRELCAEPRQLSADRSGGSAAGHCASLVGDRRPDAGGPVHARPGDARLHDQSLQAAVPTAIAGAWRDRPIPAEGLRAAVGARDAAESSAATRPAALAEHWFAGSRPTSGSTGSVAEALSVSRPAALRATRTTSIDTRGPGRIADAAGQMTFDNLLTQTRQTLDRVAAAIARLDRAAQQRVLDVLSRAEHELAGVLGTNELHEHATGLTEQDTEPFA